jgi:hypothetical protein
MTRPVSVALVLALVGCGREAAPPAGEQASVPAAPVADTATVARAQQAVAALGGGLMMALTGALERGGPPAALGYCADSAQAVTARYATEGMVARRTSLRLRNPANRPDSVERRILDRLASLHAEGRLPPEYTEVLPTPEGGWVLQLAKPIIVMEKCLACHGSAEQIAPATAKVLAARYPDDSARDYRAGDFRGIVSVRVPMTR